MIVWKATTRLSCQVPQSWRTSLEADLAYIPEDFPNSIPAVVGGAQPKVVAVLTRLGIYKEDGDSREQRYELCEDMSQQLMEYCARKRVEYPSWSEESTQQKTLAAFSKKIKAGEWEFSEPEQDWIDKRLRTLRAAQFQR
jgi:hypothetical protein